MKQAIQIHDSGDGTFADRAATLGARLQERFGLTEFANTRAGMLKYLPPIWTVQ